MEALALAPRIGSDGASLVARMLIANRRTEMATRVQSSWRVKRARATRKHIIRLLLTAFYDRLIGHAPAIPSLSEYTPAQIAELGEMVIPKVVCMDTDGFHV